MVQDVPVSHEIQMETNGEVDIMFAAEMRVPKGFTLIEMIVATSIFLVGIAGSYTLLSSIEATRAGNVKVVQVQQEARNIVERIAREMRESDQDHVWIWTDSTSGETDSIVFFTPRDESGAFCAYHEVDLHGEPLYAYPQ